MRIAISLLAALSLLLAAAPEGAEAQSPPGAVRVGDVRVRSGRPTTEIRIGFEGAPKFVDETELRTGGVTTEEIRIFFPRLDLRRARVVTVGDQNVEEVRLLAERGGVRAAIVVRRAVKYQIDRDGAGLKIRVTPGPLFAEGAAPPIDIARPAAGTSLGPGGLAAPQLQRQDLAEGEGLTVDAESISYDSEANEIVARGRVTIARDDTLLTADEVRVNRSTKVADATGNVSFSDSQGQVRASRFRIDLDDETGELENSRIYLTQAGATITGRKLEKGYGQTYRIEDGTFTTCNCGVGAPTWSIAGDEVKIRLDGYGVAKGATFRVGDIPILYLPVVAFPAKQTRQSGLLAPQFGHSGKRGFEYLQPFYLVLSKSADATFAIDIETAARIGAIAEYRYALGERSEGVLNFGFFNEGLRSEANDDIENSGVADPDIPTNRWSATVNSSQELPYDVMAFADVFAVSDDFFLREIPTFSFDPQYEVSRRTTRFTSSRVGLYRSWDQVTVLAQLQYYQDFIQDDDLTLQRLPEIDVFASERFFERRLKLRFQGEVVNFVRSEGFDGLRVDLKPELEIPFRWQEYLRGSLSAGVRETLYSQSDTDSLVPVSESGGTAAVDNQELDSSATRELFHVGLEAGTEVYRIFDLAPGGEFTRVKHTLEPKVSYLMIPDVDQEDLPFYDYVDRVNQRSLVTYGVQSRLLAKRERPLPTRPTAAIATDELNSFAGLATSPIEDRNSFPGLGGTARENREATRDDGEADTEVGESSATEDEELLAQSSIVEWARLGVFQSYDLEQSLHRDRDEKFSDVDLRLRLTPVPWFGLSFDASLDTGDSELTAANVGVVLRDPRPRAPGRFLLSGQPASLGLSYRFIEDDILREVDAALLLPLGDTFSTFYRARFDAIENEFLENRIGFRFSSACRCWIVDLVVTDRVNPDETEVRAQVTLVGLGSLGTND